MSIQLCLFDLDNTLLRTSDLEDFRGRDNVNNTGREYTRALLRTYDSRDDRLLYTPEQLADLRDEFHDILWGVFTRSPRHYATTLLKEAYPDVDWNIIVAFEDVKNTKPHPDGIYLAAKKCGIKRGDHIVTTMNNVAGNTRQTISMTQQLIRFQKAIIDKIMRFDTRQTERFMGISKTVQYILITFQSQGRPFPTGPGTGNPQPLQLITAGQALIIGFNQVVLFRRRDRCQKMLPLIGKQAPGTILIKPAQIILTGQKDSAQNHTQHTLRMRFSVG